MPRNMRIIQSVYPYHVTIRSNNKIAFQEDIESLWLYACDLLWFCTFAFNVEIHCFVLMNNHYHMIVRTPEANLDKFMNYFNRELSREISRQTGRANFIFGRRYYATVINNLRYYASAYKYVYRNPVKGQLCLKVQDYGFSTLAFITCRQVYRFPIFDSYFDKIDDYDFNLDWLNQDFSNETYLEIKEGLSRNIFSPAV